MKKSFPISPVTRRLRELRQKATPSEQILWQALRNRQLLGFKFGRQHYVSIAGHEQPMRFYIADFFCHEAKLIVELDGSAHDGYEFFDAIRDNALEVLGIRVLRFQNFGMEDLDKVLARIAAALMDRL